MNVSTNTTTEYVITLNEREREILEYIMFWNTTIPREIINPQIQALYPKKVPDGLDKDRLYSFMANLYGQLRVS